MIPNSDVMDKIEFLHLRGNEIITTKDDDTRTVISSKGGATACYLPISENRCVIGIAVCSPRDNFSKKKGRIVARGHAESNAQHGDVLQKRMDIDMFIETAMNIAKIDIGRVLENENEKVCRSAAKLHRKTHDELNLFNLRLTNLAPKQKKTV